MRHPLGFTRHQASLVGYRIRLHVWRGHSEDRHNHQYGFVSVPLWGSFVETRWDVIDGEDYRQLACSTAVGNTPMRLVGTSRRAGLRVRSVRTRWPLWPWFCPAAEDVHSLVPKGRFAVSLVLRGRLRHQFSTVYRAEEMP